MTVDQLIECLKEADEAYYNQDNSAIPDSAYDQLCKEYEALTGEAWLRIGTPSPLLTRIPHKVPMLSLDKVHSIPELISWAAAVAPKGTKCYLTPKIDGCSGAIRYEKGKLVEARSRGDGTVGESILHSIQFIPESDLPRILNTQEPIEVRGEFYIPTHLFHQHFSGAKNPRNSVAGLLRKQTPHPLQAHIRFAAYRVFKGVEKNQNITGTGTEDLNELDRLGFETPQSDEFLLEALAKLTSESIHPDNWVGEMPYEIDGVVIALDGIDLREQLGETDHHPRWAVAYKFEVAEAVVTIVGVDWSVGKSGEHIPTYVTTPANLNGTVVTRASGHNLGWYLNFGGKIGDKVVIVKAGEIIPQLVRVIREGITDETE